MKIIFFLFNILCLIVSLFTKENIKSKKSHLRKHKIKKCNPYKNGPAEWRTIEYIDHSKGDTDLGNAYYHDGRRLSDRYDIDRSRGVYVPQGEEIEDVNEN